MYKYIIGILFLGLSLQSCSIEELSQFGIDDSENLIWVFVQFNVPEEDEKIDSFWYYGQVSESLYKKISKNRIKRGFFLISNVHYWDDNILHEYKDEEHTGDLLFRIEDIRRLKVLHTLPTNATVLDNEEVSE